MATNQNQNRQPRADNQETPSIPNFSQSNYSLNIENQAAQNVAPRLPNVYQNHKLSNKTFNHEFRDNINQQSKSPGRPMLMSHNSPPLSTTKRPTLSRRAHAPRLAQRDIRSLQNFEVLSLQNKLNYLTIMQQSKNDE